MRKVTHRRATVSNNVFAVRSVTLSARPLLEYNFLAHAVIAAAGESSVTWMRCSLPSLSLPRASTLQRPVAVFFGTRAPCVPGKR